MLDISPQDSDSIRLHVVDGREDREYAALSYCWGKSPPFITLASSIKEYLEGIELSSMPKTFQDAVQVTRDLGIRFLWIDALCIVQDKNEDVINELSRMRTYYQNALVVIAASGARDVKEGFLKFRSSSGPSCSALSMPDEQNALLTDAPFYDMEGKQGRITLSLRPHSYVAREEPLNQRAWTLQERLLCPRVLGFPSTGGFFLQCEREERHDDTIHYGHRAGSERIYPSNSWTSNKHDFDIDNPHDAWFMHVRDYSSRHLSKSLDKYNAISGIAEAYHQKFQTLLGDYVAGHWRNHLTKSLHWYSFGLGPKPTPESNRPPSWSWLSVDGEVSFLPPLVLQSNHRSLVEVLFVGIRIAVEKLPFGPVELGCLSMKAQMGWCFWSPDKQHPYSPSLEWEDGSCIEVARTFADNNETFPTPRTRVYILPLCSSGIRPKLHGLLLQRVVPAFDRLYRRVGHVQGLPEDFLESCATPTIIAIL